MNRNYYSNCCSITALVAAIVTSRRLVRVHVVCVYVWCVCTCGVVCVCVIDVCVCNCIIALQV